MSTFSLSYFRKKKPIFSSPSCVEPDLLMCLSLCYVFDESPRDSNYGALPKEMLICLFINVTNKGIQSVIHSPTLLFKIVG